MKKRFSILFFLIISIFLVFSAGITSAEYPEVPDKIWFVLNSDPDTHLSTKSLGTVELTEGFHTEAAGGTTAKVFTIMIPAGTTASQIGTSWNKDEGKLSELFSTRYYINHAGQSNQYVQATTWGSTFKALRTSLDEAYIAYLAGEPNSLYVFYFTEVGDPVLTDFYAGSIANYVGNNCNVAVGALIKYAENNTPVKFYVTDKEDGTSEDAIAGTLKETTAEKVLPNRSDVFVPTGELSPGQYWIAAEVGDTRIYRPFKMYASARDYAEAMLDAMIEWNQTTGFYNRTDYVGLAGNIDGRDWYAYIFGALGYEADDPLLASADGTTYLDYTADYLSRQTDESLVVESNDSPATKRLARTILGITGIGGDPRDIGGKNLVKALISIAYEDYDIEGGKLRLDEDGSLHVRLADTDFICEGYFLTALEVANATPEEGYTEELRQAGLKALKKISTAALSSTGGDDVAGYQNGKNISDFYSMSLFACEYLNDVEGMEGDAKKLLDDFEAYYASVIANPENEMNLFSVAMATTDIVGNGVDFEAYTTNEKWKHPGGGWELAKLLSSVDENGYTGALMAQYEIMQGLVDVLNGKTCFRKAQETYLATYPQYSDEGQAVAKYIFDLPETIESTEDIEAVNTARAAYNEAYEAFMANLPEKADVAAVESYFAELETALSDAEAATTQFVKDLIEDLPEPDLQTGADAEAVAAARAAFDALTDATAADVTKAERAKLERAEKAADTIAAAEVERRLLALPAAAKVVAADGEAITAARAAYEALTEDQQKLVAGEAVAKLVDDERALEQLGAAPVIHEIDAIPDAADLSLDDKAYVEQVRANYEALSDVQKLAVTNVADLIKAETKLKKLAEKAAAAKAVDDAIADLGKAENIGLNDEEAVKAARKAFDKLSADAKAFVTAEDDLIAAEEALAAAKEEAAKAAAAKAAAEKADKAIAAIGDVTLDSEQAIAKARAIYDALSDEEKALVENGDALAAAEAKWAELKDEAEQAAAETAAAAKAAADQKAAEPVIDAIAAIGDVALDDEQAIAKARAAYDALSDDQKDLVDNAADLDAAETALAQLKEDKAAAAAVQEKIDALGDAADVTAADAKAVSAARKAFDRLSDAQKALVDNEEALKAAEDAVAQAKDANKAAEDQAAAQAVTDAINALPSVNQLTAADEAAVKAAQAAFDKLTDAQKALVGDEAKKKLADAEAKIKELDPKPRFVDVPANAYFKEAVDWAVSHEPVITTGTDATHFTPNGDCTRGQVVTFLWRAAGTPEPTSTTNPFVDVPANQYYYKAVLWAVEKGITTGTDKTHFTPNGKCTRGQVVTFLWRANGSPEVDANVSFSDVKTGAYYEKAVKWAVANKITEGTGAGKFSPDNTCTRGQVVTFLYRAQK